jgi:biotin synthase
MDMMDLRTHQSVSASAADRNVRHDWTVAEARTLHDLPFNDLLFRAHSLHRKYFDPNTVQMSRLLSIKTPPS